MPHRDRITTIHICYSLWKQGVSPEQMPVELGIHRATVYRWIRGFVRKGEKPREVIQTDTVDLGHLYAFTAIDTFTKEVSVTIASRLTALAGREALKAQLQQFGKIDHIQRDGGPEFKREWQDYALKHIASIRTARPYKKNEQTFIERFNGILRKECLGYLHYKKRDLHIVQQRVNEYLEYYHTKRPHLSLNMQTPKEFAMSHLT